MLRLTKIFLFLLFTTLTFAQPELMILMGDDSPYLPETLTYQARVEADGGTVIYIDSVDAVMRALIDSSINTSCKVYVSPNFGVKKDANNKVTKLYSLIGTTDFVQADTSKAFTWVATGGHNNGAYMTASTNDYMDATTVLTIGSDFTANVRFNHNFGSAFRLLTVNFSATDGSGMCLANQPTMNNLWEAIAWGSPTWDYTANTWAMFTLTRDGNVGTAYGNVSTTFGAINAAPNAEGTSIRIASGQNPGNYYTGKIEDVSIFNTILTEEQITIIYEQ